jgi:Fur family ferric uptake transcriptional regulator
MDKKSVDLLKKILKDNNYSLTKVRQIVCGLLWNQKPLSMRELIDISNDKIDRASLYRTIKLFEQLGLVRRLYIGWKYKVELSDILSHHHHHIVCIKCKKIAVINNEERLEKMVNEIAHRHGFVAKTHQFEISGICKACQKTD